MSYQLAPTGGNNPQAKALAEKRMRDLAHHMNMPDGSWYVISRKGRGGTVEYVGDWTKIGLLWLLQMDDRRLKFIHTYVTKSSTDNNDISVGYCHLGFFDGSEFSSEGRAAMAEFTGNGAGDALFSHCDDIAETRAMKRAAVLATAKGLIDHPSVVKDEENGQ